MSSDAEGTSGSPDGADATADPATRRSEIPRSETPRSETPRSETPRSEIPRSETPRIEIVPERGIERAAGAALPAGAHVAVTCLPTHGIEAGVETSIALAREGLAPSTHLAARRFASRAQLDDVLHALHDGGVGDLFLVGGDGPASDGPLRDGTALLRAVRESGVPFRIGVAGYPEHATTRGGETHLDLLAAKSAHADYVVTQICFRAGTVAEYVDRVRARDIDLPVMIGVPAPIGLARLLRVCARIGVTASASIASKLDGAHRLVTGRFDAARLVEELRGTLTAGSTGLHVYSFNDIDASIRLMTTASRA